MKRLLAFLVTAAIAAGACGTTVPAAQRASHGADEFGTIASADGATSTSGAAGAGAGAALVGARAARTTTSARRATSSTRGAAANAPINIGYVIPSNTSAFIGAVGVKGVSGGDQRGYATAVVNYVNAHGGVNGRKLNVVFHEWDAVAGTANSDAEAQRICAGLTEDNHVFAALSPILTGSIVYQCMAKAKTALVDDSYQFFSMADPALHSYHFSPSYPDTTRGYTAFIERLIDHGFFGPNPKIGISYDDTAGRRIAATASKNALAKHGLKPAAEVAYSSAEQVVSAVLRFKAMGIDRVIEIDGSGGLETQVFMGVAEAQGYRPRYALNTLSGPDLLKNNVSPEQLRGAAGIGWVPSVDVGVLDNSAQDRQCLGIVHAAGTTTPDNTAGRFALAACDLVFFFAEAMRHATTVDLAGFKSAGEALGTSFVPYGSFASRFGPGHHDGPTAARYLVFDDACSCFRYDGGLIPF